MDEERKVGETTGAGTRETAETAPKKKSKAPRRALMIGMVCAIALGAFGAGFGVSRLALDPEIRSLVRLKNRIQTSYYEEVTDDEFYGLLFQSVNEKLLDKYSGYLTSDEYKAVRQQAKGKQEGIGLVFSTTGEEMRVVRVCGNSPAEEAGIVAGEYILAFGKTQAELTESTLFDEFTAFLEDFEAGEDFCVKVKDNAGQTRLVTLAKASYTENYVFYRTKTGSYRFTGKDADEPTQAGLPLACLSEDTAYIGLTQFNGSAGEEFAGAMELFRAQEKKDLVLDLRGNGGGYLDIMLEIARYFCKSATNDEPLAAIADYGEYTQEFFAEGNEYYQYFSADSRICVLADDQTASASECLIGCMVDYGAIGYEDICLCERDGNAKTYGKGIMQTTYPLWGLLGDAVKLTTARICWPSGKCIHGVGVRVEDGAKRTAENADRDGEAETAIQTLYS